MDDEKIIEQFFSRSENAIAALDEKYGKLCYRLSYNILNNHSDAQECVNDAYLALWNAVPPARPHPLRAFVCKLTRNLALKQYYKNSAQKRGGDFDAAMEELENTLSDPETPESELEVKELSREIEAFLTAQAQENRVIFMRRYAYLDSYAEIAERLNLSENAVSIRLTRLRRNLKKHLTERGFAL